MSIYDDMIHATIFDHASNGFPGFLDFEIEAV